MSMQANCNCTCSPQLLSLNGEKNTSIHVHSHIDRWTHTERKRLNEKIIKFRLLSALCAFDLAGGALIVVAVAATRSHLKIIHNEIPTMSDEKLASRHVYDTSIIIHFRLAYL